MTTALKLTGQQTLPMNLEAEQAVLGALMFSNELYWRLADVIETRHFFEPLHQRIFGVIAELVASGRRASIITVAAALEGDKGLAEVNGQAYLKVMCAASIAAPDPGDYARLIRELCTRRDLLALAQELAERARNYGDGADEILSQTQRAIDVMAGSERADDPIRPIGYFADRALEQAVRVHEEGKSPGITFGIGHLDGITGGLMPADFVVLAARPGMGKSTVLAHTALSAALAGSSPLFYSFEMAGESMALRMMSALAWRAGMPFAYSGAMKAQLSPMELQYLRDARNALRALPIDLRVKRSLTVSQIKIDARRHIRALEKQGRTPGPIIIDYLGLLRPEATYRGRRYEEVTEISADLKSMAGEFNLPVLVAAQLNREVEKRQDRRPVLSDLRETGALEQDADKVLLPYRPEYYAQKDEPDSRDFDAYDQWRKDIAAVRGLLEVIVGKNRMGPEGIVKAWCDVSFNAVCDSAPTNHQREF